MTEKIHCDTEFTNAGGIVSTYAEISEPQDLALLEQRNNAEKIVRQQLAEILPEQCLAENPFQALEEAGMDLTECVVGIYIPEISEISSLEDALCNSPTVNIVKTEIGGTVER